MRIVAAAIVLALILPVAPTPAAAQRPVPVGVRRPFRAPPRPTLEPADSGEERSLFAPPSSDRFLTALGTVGVASGLTAGAFVIGLGGRDCDGTCQLVIASIGMLPGLSVGEAVVERNLKCRHRDARVRALLGATLGEMIAVAASRNGARTFAITMLAVTPVTTSYFLAGCETR